MPEKYPSCLVLESDYRYRLPMRKLVEDYPDLAVVRRCKHPQPFAQSASGQHEQLRSDVFGDEDLREMSCNLLGGRFRMKHLPFAPAIGLVQEDWDGKQLPSLPLSPDAYSVKESTGIIGFRVEEINRYAFPYTMALPKKDYEQKRQDSERIRKREQLDIKEVVIGVYGQAGNGDTLVYAWLHVNHHPNIFNYWHMQIDVYPAGADAYLKSGQKTGESRRVKHRLREALSRKAICKLGHSYHIGERYYKRGTHCICNTIDDKWNGICRSCFTFPYSPVASRE